MRRIFHSFSLYLVCAALLSACGFHLRAALSLPAERMPLYLSAEGGAARIMPRLRETLERQDIKLVSNRQKSKAATLVFLRAFDFQRRVLSVSALTAQTREIELHYALEMEVRDAAGGVLLAPRRLALSRDYVYDETLVLAQGEEEQTLRGDLEADLVAQITRILASLGRKKTPSSETE